MNNNQCKNCGSTNIYQESANIYRCGDCFEKIPRSQISPPSLPGPAQRTKQPETIFKLAWAGFSLWFVLGYGVYSFLSSSNSLESFVSWWETNPEPSLPQGNVLPIPGEFTYLTALPNDDGNLEIVGIFQNQSGYAIDFPEFKVTLMDKEGKPIGESFGQSDKSFLLPNETTSFKIRYESAPQSETFFVECQAKERITNSQKNVLEIGQLKLELLRNQPNLIHGILKNNGTDIASQPKVHCLLLNQKGVVEDFGSVDTPSEELLPGAEDSFSVELYRKIPAKGKRTMYCQWESSLKGN